MAKLTKLIYRFNTFPIKIQALEQADSKIPIEIWAAQNNPNNLEKEQARYGGQLR
jgi:hypothetical protein